jgi:hypothetical protein
MNERPTDTDTEAERVQIELLRRASCARRTSLAFSLSRTVIQLARRAIRRAHPGASQAELGLLFVSVHYGDDLARAMRSRLAQR